MPKDYVPPLADPLGGDPVVFHPSTFDRHAGAVEAVEGDNQARYPRVGRGRTTKPSPGTWGYLASGHSIPGASGLTLGSGTVTLCSRSGDAIVADGEDVTVYNAGGTIAGPKPLELDWTDGDWAVCTCGSVVGCLFCRPCQVPTKDLLYVYTGHSPLTSAPGNGVLAFDGTDTWTGGPFEGGYTIQLKCVANVITPKILLGGVSQCTFGSPSATCNPLAMSWSVPSPSAAATAGFTGIQISDPGPSVTPCPQPCDCSNCKACNGVIVLSGGTVADGNGTHALTGGAIQCTGILTASGMPLTIGPQPGPPATDCHLGTTDVTYTLCMSCHPTDQNVTITLTVNATPSGCLSAAGFQYCGYGIGVQSVYTKVVTPVCSGGTLTATADFSVFPGGVCTGGTTGHSADVPQVVGSVTFSIPLGPTDAMCQAFSILGCNFVGMPATVSVYDHSGGTLLYSGTTNSGGGISTVYFPNQIAPYWIVVTPTSSRGQSHAGSHTLTCNGTTTIVLSTDSNYVCVAGCGVPIAKTLHATHPKFGAITLVYDASGSLGAGWYATVSYSYTGCRCCPSKTVTVTCFMNTSKVFSDHWKSN